MNQPIYPVFDPAAPRFMTVGQILDRIFRLMRTHLRLFLSIAAVPSSALMVFFTIFGGFAFILIRESEATKLPPHGIAVSSMFALMAALYLLMPAVGALYLPAASYAAMQADFGATVSFRQGYQTASRRFGRYLWLMVLGSLYILAPMALIGGLAALSVVLIGHSAMSASNPAAPFAFIPLIVLLYLGFVVYSILIVLRFALAYPACVAEGLPASSSLKRSAQLTRGAKGRIFLVLLVVYAAMYAVNLMLMCVMMLLGAVGAIAALMVHVTVGSPAFYILIGLAALGYLLLIDVSSMVSYAAYTTSLAVLYHDQCRRKHVPLPEPPAEGAIIPG